MGGEEENVSLGKHEDYNSGTYALSRKPSPNYTQKALSNR